MAVCSGQSQFPLSEQPDYKSRFVVFRGMIGQNRAFRRYIAGRRGIPRERKNLGGSRMRKTFGALIALAAGGLALPGAALAQTKIVIGIPTSPPNIVHMPPIVAKELGLYKKAGIDADMVSLGDGTKVFSVLLVSYIDFDVHQCGTIMI